MTQFYLRAFEAVDHVNAGTPIFTRKRFTVINVDLAILSGVSITFTRIVIEEVGAVSRMLTWVTGAVPNF